jgi:hypothetical protein
MLATVSSIRRDRVCRDLNVVGEFAQGHRPRSAPGLELSLIGTLAWMIESFFSPLHAPPPLRRHRCRLSKRHCRGRADASGRRGPDRRLLAER